MNSFRDYLEQVSTGKKLNRPKLNTTAEIINAIHFYDNEDEILNPDFLHIKDWASGVWDREGRDKLRKILLSIRSHDNLQQDIEDLLHSIPNSYTSFTKTKKALKDVKNQDVIHQFTAIIAIWEEIATSLKTLKPKVVKVSQKRAEKKEREKQTYAASVGSFKIMVDLLEKHRKEYINGAVEYKEDHIKAALNTLKKNDWNIDNLLDSRMPRSYNMDIQRYYESFTESVNPQSSYSRLQPKEPNIRVEDKKAIKSMLKETAQAAQLNYDSFIAKIVGKVGEPVVDAELKGNIWTGCTLTVETKEGETQVWDTKIIVNISKLGKVFNQFPTRRKK
jgi:uncharacterized protein YoxC